MENYNDSIQVGIPIAPESSRIKIWVIPGGKDPEPGKMLADSKGNTEKVERRLPRGARTHELRYHDPS